MNKHDFHKVRLIESKSNFGVYNSRDELLKLISIYSQFILSIDDDVIIPPLLFSELLPVFFQNDSIGIIGPRSVYDDGSFQTAHGAGFINWWLGKYYVKDAKYSLECDYVIGCCMLIRKSVIENVGGFDRDYYTSHGEVDFCVKARQKGYKVLYYPNVCVKHRVERGGTQTSEPNYYLFRNELFVSKKNAPLPQKWIALSLYFLFWPLKAIFDSFRRNRSIDLQEIKTILNAITDAWLNRSGKRT
jgi:GT2 family glycosyltransferase